MSLWCDEKYLRLLSPQLDRFAQRGPRLFNCRCPLCGDSSSNKIKARGYFFAKQQTLLYKCHNCNIALPFAALLKRLSRTLYDEYVMENFEQSRVTPVVAPSTVPVPTRHLHTYPEVIQLSSSLLTTAQHDVLAFVRARQLPARAAARLYATTAARTWLTPLVGAEKAARVADDRSYLVIPLKLTDGSWYGAQVRDVTRKEYITFRWGHETLRTFGLDAWNPALPTYCVEGPLDALCLANALAFCGSDLLGGLDRMTQAGLPIHQPILVWDNEPRNTQITRHLRDAVAQGHRVVIWRREWPKDPNDMVLAGYDVEALLTQRTFQGMQAELEYRLWQKSQ